MHRNQSARCVRTVELIRAQCPELWVLVVDNGSERAERDAVLAAGLDVLALEDNRGFGGGANAGLHRWLEQRSGDWVAIAPHDAEPAEDTLELVMASVAGERRVGLVSADVGDQARPVVDPYMGALPGRALAHRGWEPSDYPHGTLLVAARPCLDDIGLFDERYFAYGEEADLGLRARRRGWAVGLVRGAMVTNPMMSSSTAAVDYLKQRNAILLARRHFGRWRAFMRLVFGLVGLVNGALRPSRRPPWFSAPARRRALWDGLRGRGGPPPDGLAASDGSS